MLRLRLQAFAQVLGHAHGDLDLLHDDLLHDDLLHDDLLHDDLLHDDLLHDDLLHDDLLHDDLLHDDLLHDGIHSRGAVPANVRRNGPETSPGVSPSVYILQN